MPPSLSFLIAKLMNLMRDCLAEGESSRLDVVVSPPGEQAFNMLGTRILTVQFSPEDETFIWDNRACKK